MKFPLWRVSAACSIISTRMMRNSRSLTRLHGLHDRSRPDGSFPDSPPFRRAHLSASSTAAAPPTGFRYWTTQGWRAAPVLAHTRTWLGTLTADRRPAPTTPEPLVPL